VEDRNGITIWATEPDVRQVIDPATAFLTVSMMQDVVNRGTGTAVRAVGFRGAAAGKTGTTQDAADAWFVGITPHIAGTVWIGLDKRERIVRGATGGELAAPVWGRIMARSGLEGGGGWSPPSGVEQRVVDETGLVVAENCPATGATRNEYFLRGTAPIATCYPTGYAWNDSLGYDPYASADSLDDDGWWARLRRRLFARDSTAAAQDSARLRMGADTVQRDTMLLPDSAQRVRRLPTRADSLRPRVISPDSLRKPPREPIGTPVRPRPDTTSRPPRPDTIPAQERAGGV
jgi:penicillin-binding protein 1A